MTQTTEPGYRTDFDKLFIGGQWVAPASSDVIEVFSPATGEKVGQVPLATAADVDAACAAARRAFDEGPWPRMTPHERQAVIAKAVELITARADEFKHLLTLETGQPATIVDIMQFGAGVTGLQYYAGAADKFSWRDIRDGIYGQTLVLREPIGVVGAVVAWNVPFFLACNKLGPALLAGCTMVLKPAAETPLSTNLLAEVFTAVDRLGRAGLYLVALQPVVDGTVQVALQAYQGQAATTVAMCDTGVASASLLGAPSIRAGAGAGPGDTIAVTVAGVSADRVCVFEPVATAARWTALPSARVFGRDSGGAPTRARSPAQLVVAPLRRLGCRFDLLVPTGLRAFDFFGDDDDQAPCEYDRGPTPLGIPETTDALAVVNLGDPDAGGEDADELVFESGVYGHFTGDASGPIWQRLYPATRLANPWGQAVVGDVDGNGQPDLVVRAVDRRATGDVPLDAVLVLRNLGTTPLGVRLAATRFPTVGPVRALLAADFTGDGAADVLMADQRQLGDGDGATLGVPEGELDLGHRKRSVEQSEQDHGQRHAPRTHRRRDPGLGRHHPVDEERLAPDLGEDPAEGHGEDGQQRGPDPDELPVLLHRQAVLAGPPQDHEAEEHREEAGSHHQPEVPVREPDGRCV